MKYSARWKEVPLPERMASLPKDHRGYPIPDNILKDDAGVYHFIINDSAKRSLHITNRLCAICGQDLFGDYWLVGGALSAFHPQGAYNDTAQHEECVKYAMQVCPFMAMRPYTRPEPEKVQARVQSEQARLYVDLTQIPGQPEIHVLIKVSDWDLTLDGYIKPHRPYQKIELWREGRQLNPHNPGDALLINMLQPKLNLHKSLGVLMEEYSNG